LPDAKEWIREHVEIYTLEYLQNRDHYPEVDGKIAFFDEESASAYKITKGKPFQPRNKGGAHLIDLWTVSAYYDGNKLIVDVDNNKTVNGWRLVGRAGKNRGAGLLTSGTSYYSIREANTRPMHFYDRYRGVWNYNRYGRKGIRSELIGAFNLLIEEAIDYGMTKAAEEYVEQTRERRFVAGAWE
jgi:hypothetical protein